MNILIPPYGLMSFFVVMPREENETYVNFFEHEWLDGLMLLLFYFDS